MFERINRRLEVLAREIAAGPKLKPGFTLTNGMLGYAPPLPDGSWDKPVVKSVVVKPDPLGWGAFLEKYLPKAAPSFDPMTEPLQVGDLVEIVFNAGSVFGKQATIKNLDDGIITVRCGNKNWVFACRSSFKLIEKAPCPV